MMILYRISFVGAGKVAGALCKELFSKGHLIQHIVSTSGIDGSSLADSCNATLSSDLTFPRSPDIIIVAVPDHCLKDVLGKIICSNNTIIAHTAGSLGLEVFPPNFENKGILYPLQTFSKERKLDFSAIPFFVEASNNFSATALENIVKSLDGAVHFSDTGHRRLLHLAAVFVSNFSNHMFTAGMELSCRAGYSFDVLKPLILETVKKALDLGPENAQTGPAVRYDFNTIEKHMDLLSYSPELKGIYRETTNSIISYYKKNLQNDKF